MKNQSTSPFSWIFGTTSKVFATGGGGSGGGTTTDELQYSDKAAHKNESETEFEGLKEE